MTVTAPSPRIAAFAGDGGSGPFPLPFRVLEAADVRAVVIAGDGARAPLEGLVIEGEGEGEAGAVQATPPRAIAVGETLVLWTDTALVQPADYIAADAFPAETHEAALDRLTLIAQDQRRDLARALAAPPGDTLGPLPDAARRKGMLLTFDPETGDPVTDRDYAGFVAEVVAGLDVGAEVVGVGSEQISLIEAAGESAVAEVQVEATLATSAVNTAGETQVGLIEAAGEAAAAPYFVTDAAGLEAVADQGAFGVHQAFGKGLDWKKDNAGSAKFLGLGAGPLGADIRAVRTAQHSVLAATQFPPGWTFWFAMDAELTDRRYIPYRSHPPALGQNRALANTFGAGELRTDGSTGNPALTRFAADGPLGVGTACLAVFGATSHVLEVIGSDTFDLVSGKSYTMELTAVTTGGVGAKNYRLGQTTGTASVDYAIVAIPDESGVTFTDPTSAAIKFTHTFTADPAKKVGILPSTSGDACTLKIGSIRLVQADSDLSPLAVQSWGSLVCRGSAAGGGVVLDQTYCFTMAGLTDGLIDFNPIFPAAADYSVGKTTLVLGEFVGGAGSGTYGVMCGEDFDTGLTPSTAYTTFAIAFGNSTEEGQFAPQPGYSNSRHGANGMGLGLQVWWNSVGLSEQEYGVDQVPLYKRSVATTGWAGRAERLGSYNGTRDITHASFRNNMRIAAKASKKGKVGQAERVQAIKALKEQYALAAGAMPGILDAIVVIGDSNDTRATNEWTYSLSASGYMGVGQQNALLRIESVGGKGLYGTGLFVQDAASGGFLDQFERAKVFIDLCLEGGIVPGVLLRGVTNDYDEVASDKARVIGEYTAALWDPIRARGAHLLLTDVLPSSARFTESDNLYVRAAQKAYAASHVGQVWHYDAANAGMWNVANQASYFQVDNVHLDTATGDPVMATAVKSLITSWRAGRQ